MELTIRCSQWKEFKKNWKRCSYWVFILCVGVIMRFFIHPEQYTRAINAAIEVLELKK